MSHGSRFVKLLTLVALLAGLVGCGATVDAPQLGDASDPSASRTAPSPATASSQTARSSATASSMMNSPPTTALASSRDSADVSDATDYRITSQDILQVAIFQVPDLTRTVQVDGSGFVSLFPLVGRVPVRGKTILQAQEDITARYRKSYLQSPQVTLSLVKSGQRVTVSGAVKSPTVLTS